MTEAPTGEEALATFEERPDAFTIVVLDLTLPGIQGRAVMQAMRDVRPDLPIVLTSGYTAEEAGDLTTAPRTVFLPKPWRPEQLVRCVARPTWQKGPACPPGRPEPTCYDLDNEGFFTCNEECRTVHPQCGRRWREQGIMSTVAPLHVIRPRQPKPEWLKVKAPGSENYLRLTS